MNTPYQILVYDVRPDGHQSFSVLPKLGQNDIEKLAEFYKFKFDFSKGYEKAITNNDIWWGIYAIELKAGHAILQPAVFNLRGEKMVGSQYNIAGFLSYPNHSKTLDPEWSPLYYEKGEVWWTEGHGDVGLGYSGESHIGEDGGPFRLWVSKGLPPDIVGNGVGSDLIYDLGWWDDHITPNPQFRLMRKNEAPEPPTPTGSAYLVTRDASGNAQYHIRLNPGSPPGGIAAHVIEVDGAGLYYIPLEAGAP